MQTHTSGSQAGWYANKGKRYADALVATLLLVISSPVLLLTAAGVWIALGSPILFRQQRAGKDGHSFTLVKFRSMLPAQDGSGAPLSDARRLTMFGRLLRQTSLDELPELWNIVRGDMSLVGPRPLLLRYTSRYTEVQVRRLTVRPGLTGWAQIHGRNDTTWTERLDRDVWYVDHISPSLDLRILFRTIPVVLGGKGVRPTDEPFMEEFTGDRTENPSNHSVRS